MRVMILGANGFIGKRLCKLLKNHEIIPIVRDGKYDLLSFAEVSAMLQFHTPDVIVNAAFDKNVGAASILNNVQVFMNFYNNNIYFDRYINIGSGAEFDKSKSITNAYESELKWCFPLDSYGFVKNQIARICSEKENFYTLRLFGCFGWGESPSRLFPTLTDGLDITIRDCWFDYISIQDFAKIVDHYTVASRHKLYRDVNCVYADMYKLSEVANMFANVHKIDDSGWKYTQGNHNYTGSGDRLESMNIKLDGLLQGIKDYYVN